MGASVALAGAPTIIYSGVPPGFLLFSSSFLVIQYHTINVLTFLTTRAKIRDLDDLIKEAISINDRWYDFTLENRYNGGIRGYSGTSGRNNYSSGYQSKKTYGR